MNTIPFEDRERIADDEDLNSFNSYFVTAEKPWPWIDGEAYHGLVGEIVETIEPHSEADPVAILVQLLAAAGNVIGRSCYYQIESDRHHANLFAVLVGPSSKARKGTSWGRVSAVAQVVDPKWEGERVRGGLSSGEGFINEVRDEVTQWDPKESKWGVIDPGAADKRLMVIEPEFAGLLSVMERPGNTLSPVLRKAWDGNKLETMTRNSPLKATGAHVSIIGHITVDELRARLTRTDTANGFANRFLFPLVKRSKYLPFGGDLTDSQIAMLGERLGEVIKSLPQEPRRITMTDDARSLWTEQYEGLSDGLSGLVGAVTGRGEAQTVRLAMLYAVLDGKLEIDVPHLTAALALWRYCEASAVYIFGDTVGDDVADTILKALRARREGMSRTGISDLFGRNASSARIGEALSLLAGRGLARMKLIPSPGNRPTELWLARQPLRSTN
jgi:Protein of unknown function (DUF3987)